MAEFDQRADKHKRIIPAGFKETCESGVDIIGKGPALAVIDVLLEFGADINLRSEWDKGPFGVLDYCREEDARE